MGKIEDSYFKSVKFKLNAGFYFIKNNKYFSLLSIFLFFLILNSIIYFTISNVSSSDDQWFYFKMADLARNNGWDAIINFKGAFFTDLAQSNYSYAFGLYHFFLIPFTLFSNKILGLKLSGLIFASLVPTIAFGVLNKFNIKNSLFWVTLFFYALASLNFTFRLFLNRPFVLSDAFILIEIYLIFKKKYWILFVMSLIHTWWHPATFWMPIMLVICYEIIMILHRKKNDYKNFILAAAGSLGAFILFPVHSHTFLSPANPYYFIKKLFSFVYGLGSGPKIIEGNENYKGDVFGLLSQSNIIFILLVLIIISGIILYVYRKRNNDIDLEIKEERVILREYIFLIVIIIFLGFVFSKRFEDLLVPMAMFGSAVLFQTFVENKFLILNNSIAKKIIAVSLIVFVTVAIGNRILDLRNLIGNDNDYLKYEKAGNWLKENSDKGEIIFNTDFGQFNRLFFYDSENRYIVGLEPKNMYEFSQEHYWLWHNISIYGVASTESEYDMKQIYSGKEGGESKRLLIENSKQVASIIKEKFKSRYIFFDRDTFFRKELDENKENYELAYEDKQGGIFIYKIIENGLN